MYRCLDHTINIRIALAAVSLPCRGLILEDQKKAPRQRLLIANVFDEPKIFFPQLTALGVILPGELLTNHGHMLIGIRFAAHGLELQPHGTDLQPGSEGGNDVILFLAAAKQEVDGQYLDDLHIPIVGRLDDPIADLPNRQEILYERTGSASSFSAFCGFLSCFHICSQSSDNAVFCDSIQTAQYG